MEYSGKFLVVDGLDGSGKTTQIELLAKYLESKGYKVHLTKEPTNNFIGGLIRKILRFNVENPQDMLQLMFAADRADHLHTEIIPALKRGEIVLCDRYVYSSMAFGALDLDMMWLHDINKNFLQPDLTIYVRVPAVICFQRISSRSGNNKTLFEKADKLEQVCKNFDKISKSFPNIAVIDGNRPVDEVFNSVKEAVDTRLGLEKVASSGR